MREVAADIEAKLKVCLSLPPIVWGGGPSMFFSEIILSRGSCYKRGLCSIWTTTPPPPPGAGGAIARATELTPLPILLRFPCLLCPCDMQLLGVGVWSLFDMGRQPRRRRRSGRLPPRRRSQGRRRSTRRRLRSWPACRRTPPSRGYGPTPRAGPPAPGRAKPRSRRSPPTAFGWGALPACTPPPARSPEWANAADLFMQQPFTPLSLLECGFYCPHFFFLSLFL